MKLTAVLNPHLLELMRWFPDRHSCSIWAGPEFRYPYTEASFREDIRPQLPSYSMVADNGELLGFGQYYVREARCHLARLAISPAHRGRALGAFLIRELCRLGCRDLKTSECSLFVLESNAPAVKLYTRLGFKQTQYPGKMPPIAGCVYMVASHDLISGSVARGFEASGN